MLLTIHNLPSNTRYADVKSLLQSKCGLQHVILDNLVADGAGKKITVGVAEDADAAILVRKINGLYWNDQQLYVEDVRQQKTASEQPFRSAITRPPDSSSNFLSMNLQQHSSYNTAMGLGDNTLTPIVQPLMTAMYYVPDYQNQNYMQSGGFGQSNYLQGHKYEQVTQKVQNSFMGPGGYSQTATQLTQVGTVPQFKNQQNFSQSQNQNLGWGGGYDEKQNFAAERPLLGRRSPDKNCDMNWIPNQINRRMESPVRDRSSEGRVQPWAQASNNRAQPEPNFEPDDRSRFKNQRPDFRLNDRFGFQERRPDFSPDDRSEFNKPRLDFRPNDRSGFEERRPDFRPNDRSGFEERRPDFRPNDRSNFEERRPNFRPNDRSNFEERRPDFKPNDRSSFEDRRPVFRPDDRSGFKKQRADFRSNDRSGFEERRSDFGSDDRERRNQFSGRLQEFSGRPNKRRGRSNVRGGFSDRPRAFEPPNERYVPQEFSGKQRRPNDFVKVKGMSHPGSSRPNVRSELRQSDGGPEFPSRVSNERFKKPERGNLRPDFPNSKKRKFEQRFEEREIDRPERLSRPKTVRQQPVKKAKYPAIDQKCVSAYNGKISKKMLLGGLRKIIYEINQSVGTTKPDLMTRRTLRRLVTARMMSILNGRTMVTPLECFDLYRAKYPAAVDKEIYETVSAMVAKQEADKPLDIKTEVPVKPENAEPAVLPTPAAPSKLTKAERNINKKIKEAKHLLSQGKVPLFPEGDKRKVAQHRKEEKEGFIPEVEPKLKVVIDEEVKKIADLFVQQLDNASNEKERQAYTFIDKAKLASEITKNLTLGLSRRITDSGLKVVRIYGQPKLPKREPLAQFLRRYGALSLRKSSRVMMFTAAFDTYKQYDELCALAPVTFEDGNIVSFKPFHVATKHKADQRSLKIMRKKLLSDMIEKSDINLLEKDWPDKEAELKKKQAELAAEEKKVEHENAENTVNDVKDVNLTGDNDDTKKENNYLDEDFHVIDEINETDSDVEYTGCGNEIIKIDEDGVVDNDVDDNNVNGNDVDHNNVDGNDEANNYVDHNNADGNDVPDKDADHGADDNADNDLTNNDVDGNANNDEINAEASDKVSDGAVVDIDNIDDFNDDDLEDY